MTGKPHGASLIIAPLLTAASTFLWTEGRYGAAGGTLPALSGVFWAHPMRAGPGRRGGRTGRFRHRDRRPVDHPPDHRPGPVARGEAILDG